MGVTSKIAGMAGSYVGAKIGGAVGRVASGKKGARYGKIAGKLIGGYAASEGAKMIPIIGSFKKGGRVKRTGAYLLHKGEHVVPARKKKRIQ